MSALTPRMRVDMPPAFADLPADTLALAYERAGGAWERVTREDGWLIIHNQRQWVWVERKPTGDKLVTPRARSIRKVRPASGRTLVREARGLDPRAVRA